MATDPKDLGALQTALNDAASKASVLWTTFITFELYLAIAFGAITHRNLFLEDPIKLPVLNVDLPLVGFFVVAPTILVIFHFYIFLQLLALARKAKDYDSLLRQTASEAIDRQLFRQRLDSFLVLQFLAGPVEQRIGFAGISLRLIAWITVVGAPVLILLQGLVTFLPYHHEGVTCFQRGLILTDLAVVWYFWMRIRSGDALILTGVPRETWPIVGSVSSVCVILFSVSLATYPGEALEKLPDVRLIPQVWRPDWSKPDHWTSFHELLFAGPITTDYLSGRPVSLFSNRLVLMDQSFVDPDKLGKMDTSRSLRGRDLKRAVLDRVDLRNADFTGAMLNGATFVGAKLQNARFGCKEIVGALVEHRWPNDGCTWLQGTLFFATQLQGASFEHARLQGAYFGGAQLQGASFDWAELHGASFTKAQLQGASLRGAKLEGARLDNAQLQGASLYGAQLQGALLDRAELQGVSLESAKVWRVLGTPTKIELTNLDNLDLETGLWWRFRGITTSVSTFADARDSILKDIPDRAIREEVNRRLSALDPAVKWVELVGAEFWNKARSAPPQGEERKRRLAAFLGDLACSNASAPYIARGLLRHDTTTAMRMETADVADRLRKSALAATGIEITTIAERLRRGKSDQTSCPGVKGFTDKDWVQLEEFVKAAKVAADIKTK